METYTIPRLSETQMVILSLRFMFKRHITNQGIMAKKKSIAAAQANNDYSLVKLSQIFVMEEGKVTYST